MLLLLPCGGFDLVFHFLCESKGIDDFNLSRMDRVICSCESDSSSKRCEDEM